MSLPKEAPEQACIPLKRNGSLKDSRCMKTVGQADTGQQAMYHI